MRNCSLVLWRSLNCLPLFPDQVCLEKSQSPYLYPAHPSLVSITICLLACICRTSASFPHREVRMAAHWRARTINKYVLSAYKKHKVYLRLPGTKSKNETAEANKRSKPKQNQKSFQRNHDVQWPTENGNNMHRNTVPDYSVAFRKANCCRFPTI